MAMVPNQLVVAATVILSSLFSAECSNILCIIPVGSPSHFIVFNKLLTTLAERGHNVDVVSHFPQKQPLPHYTDLSIKGIAPELINNLSISVVGDTGFQEIMEFMLNDCGHQTCINALRTPVLQDLKRTKRKYDLLITELFATDCMFGYAHLFKVPVVSVTTSIDLPWGGSRIGNPDHPAYIPTYFTTATRKMDFLKRLENVFKYVASKIGYYWLSVVPANELCKEFFGPDLPDISELILNTSLVLINSHFSINQPRPTVPNFVEVGGLHIGVPKPVPKNIENVIKKSPNGFIYLTMGSMLMTESFDVDKLQGMFDAFSELPHLVLWKADKDKFPKGLRFPNNIHFEKWMPQLDILCHPNIKMFVSHGGLLGSQEAIYCGVPRIGIPIFADQDLNIFQSVEMGIAVKVDFNNVSKESMLEASKEILNNEKYKNNAKRISEIFKDRQNHPLDTAIYWIEYVIKYQGAQHLRSAGADLLWYQYYLVDILLFVTTIIIILIYICAAVSKLIRNLLFNNVKYKVKSS